MNKDKYIEILAIANQYHSKLIVVSKTKPITEIQKFYALGQRTFGENRVQELVEKQALLPNDIEWHLIGHLQTNKVKYIAPFIHTIHAVDSESLLREIDKQAAKVGRKINCLLQLHIAQEETKFGWNEEELMTFLHQQDISEYPNVNIQGLMAMATNTNDEMIINKEFASLKAIFDRLKVTFFKENNSFNQLSMGMSSDYQIALKNGATMIRVGSLLFSE